MQRLERNIFKVIVSICDALKTWGILQNTRVNGMTIDTFLFLISIFIIVPCLYLLYPLISIPQAFSQSLVLIGISLLFLPYTIYFVVCIFHRPIPFFYEKKWTLIPAKFTGKVVIFGKSNYSYQIKGDIRDLFKKK
jgi:hypothetical protein